MFYRALRQLDVTLMQTNFEADSYLAELAQAENCSVASNDSDFFVYDVDFVPLDAFRFSTVEIGDDNSRYLSCRRFNKAKFLRTFNLTTNRHLYLFSSVLGNDYIPLHAFEKFFSQVKMPKKKTLDKRKKVSYVLRRRRIRYFTRETISSRCSVSFIGSPASRM